MTLAPKWQDCPIDTYYTINRILLLCVGLWPYQMSITKHITMISVLITLASLVIFQLTVFVTTQYNVDILLHVLAYTIPWLATLLKYGSLCVNIKQMRKLMDRVRCDWNELNNMQEIKIIKEYSAIGRLFTIITSLYIYVGIICFILVQFFSNFLLDNISNKNESRLPQFPILVECFIDQQKYFFPLLLLGSIGVLYALTVVVATETINISYIYHMCGLFKIASYRIEQALFKNTIHDTMSFLEKESVICQEIISGFNMYQKAIKFLEIFKKSYTWGYSFLLPLAVLSLSINLYRLSRLVESKNYNEIMLSLLLILDHFWYLFFFNYLGQKVIDHSSDIYHRIYNMQWYLAPLKAQKLLMLVMQRSMRHCVIIVIGIFVLSFEGFATLTSTSISYFAIIFSLF